MEFDPEIVSYQTLLDGFWDFNEAVISLYSRQYYSIIFTHDKEQEETAIASYKQQLKKDGSTVLTEIVPFSIFYQAEDYHQKFYLQRDNLLGKEVKGNYGSFQDFVDSTIAARLNGYAAGYGDKDTLSREIGTYGLSVKGNERLLKIAERGLTPVCGKGCTLENE